MNEGPGSSDGARRLGRRPAVYDRQEQGVGGYFFDSLFSEIDSLVLHAGIHRVQFGYHRLLARRFPYAIYYRITVGEAVVHRVLDCRRDPKWIRRALAGKNP